MKNTYKSFALLCMGLAAVACVEENFEPESSKIDTTPGSEIVFTASADIEDGFKSDRKTKTVYGDKDEANKMIEINWVSGDKISIASPQATGVDVGHYQVSANSQNNGKYDGAHRASELTRLGDAGLQWTTEEDYDFYAVYPSVMNDAEASLTKKGVFTGVVPREQTYKGGALVPATDKNGKSGYIATPNMEYAFMTAKSDYLRIKEDGTQNNDPINLQFNSLVTALQFDITAGTIANVKDQVTNTSVTSYDIVSVSLISKSKNISGPFEYDIENDSYKSTNTATTLSNRVIMHFEDNPVILKSGGDFLDVTFFLLPEEIAAGDLQLQILFKFGSTQLSRTATINHALSPGKKYIFNDVKLENFTKDVEAGSWFDTIDPNTLLSQLSIPVASNVFATSVNGFAEKSVQQILDYESLWNLGVRGFELVNRRTVTKSSSWGQTRYSVDNDWSLSGAHFVCDEVAHEDDNVTFGKAFETLASKLKQNPKEFLVVFCTYQAVSDGYNPDGYVKQLLNYLDAFVASETNGFSKEDFIQITSSTKVADAQGKICVIIRPGDDDRYENQTNSSSEVNYGNADKRTSSIVLESSGKVDWSANVTLISDWGTAFDVWDRRYEGVARESTFETEYYHGTNRSPKLEQIENWLWGVSSSSTQYANVSNYNNFNQGATWPKKLDKFDYEHVVKGAGVSKAYIQEWARVSEGRFYAWTGISRSSRYLWVDWPDSYTEKLEAIDGLFKMSVAELGLSSDNIYINSLSGYLISSDIKEGQYPFKNMFNGFTYNDWGTTRSDVTNQGKGGDHPLLAYKLNKYVYGILSGESTMQDGSKLASGPWGFVMMEHIGNKSKGEDDMSIKLVDLIMMNNFKLDLTTTTPSGGQGGEGGGSTGTTSVKDYNSVYMDGENAISFE